MKRRNFVQALLVVPASSVAAEQATTPAPPQTTQPPARPPMSSGPAKLAVTQPDTTSDTVTGFFNEAQFAALRRLADLLMPPVKSNPGALDAHAPEFLDFLVSCSPNSTQILYREGIDGLNSAAKKHFHTTFAQLDAKQADAIVRPLLAARFWSLDKPKDPMRRFIQQAHQDIRVATMNSAEWAASGSSSGTRGRFNSGRRPYWKPIDPRVES